MERNSTDGASCPENPALQVKEPLSMITVG